MRLTIYKKLLLGFISVILVMMIANGYVLWELNSVTKTTTITFSSDVRSITLAKQMQTILFDEERFAGKYLVSLDSAYYLLFEEQSRLFEQFADSLYDSSPNQTEVGLLYRLRNGHRWLSESIHNSAAKRLANTGRGNVIFEDARNDSLEALHAVLDRIIQSNEQGVSNSVAGIGEAMVRSSNVAWLITVGAFLVALMVALLITGTIIRPIRVLIKGTENIAQGIFDPIDVPSKDEISMLARAVNEMSSRLKKINDLKTEMLHHISHELRTPLQTMLSAQYLLSEQKRGPLNDDQMRLLSAMKEGITKLTIFSNQFLDIQKIEHGSMEYHFVRTNALEIIRRAVEDATLIAGQKDVRVSFTHENDLPDIMSDPERISQVFSNLLSNAVKYTDSGGGISVHVARYKKSVRATVSDSGVGIGKEDLPRIFTKFYQAKNSRKGTGIGLALVKHLVDAHKGRISVTSELGKGTTFTVELPAAAETKKDQLQHSVSGRTN